MINLNATTKSLEIKLGGAVAAAEPIFTTSYVDITISTFAASDLIEQDGTSNGATAVTITSAPGAGVTRQVKFISVYNADSASVALTVQLNNNGTKRVLLVAGLSSGESLLYGDGGWVVLTTTGAIKSSGSSGITAVPNGGTGVATLTAHGVLIGEGASSVAVTSAGTVGKVLTSNGASADPTFDPASDANGFRLTLTTGVAVTTSDVTGASATTIYWTPYTSNVISLYDGSAGWKNFTSSEISIAVPATTSTMYDVFVYNNAGTPTLETLAWTNDTTRATALVYQDGRLVKSGATTRRYVGSFRTAGSSGQTEDSETKRYLWNYYHRAHRSLKRYESTTSWNYTITTIRQAVASSANQVEVVVGYAEVLIELSLTGALISNSTGNVYVNWGIGEDSTTTYVVNANGVASTSQVAIPGVWMVKAPAVGRHFYSWNEDSGATGTTTFWGANNGTGTSASEVGLSGCIEG